MMGMGEKPRNTKNEYETKVKIPRLVDSTKWRPTIFRCSKKPKTSCAYPKWEMFPILMGQKEKDRVEHGMDS